MTSVVMTRGVEFPIEWIFKTAPTVVKNLTGYEVLIQIRPSAQSTTLIKEWTEASGEVLFTPATGSVKLTLKPSTTLAFDFKQAVMDCWVYNGVTDTDGDRSPVVSITLDHGVSRL